MTLQVITIQYLRREIIAIQFIVKVIRYLYVNDERDHLNNNINITA